MVFDRTFVVSKLLSVWSSSYFEHQLNITCKLKDTIINISSVYKDACICRELFRSSIDIFTNMYTPLLAELLDHYK